MSHHCAGIRDVSISPDVRVRVLGELASVSAGRKTCARKAFDDIVGTLDLDPTTADRADNDLVPRGQASILENAFREGDLNAFEKPCSPLY
jgi:hypothetical protein